MQTSPMTQDATSVQLRSENGVQLGASWTRGRGAGWVVIAGATAVPHRFYEPLASWLAEHCGVDVLRFDYRGIAASREGSLRGDASDLRGWAQDLATAIEFAAARGPTVVVGHSVGGHTFGMTDAHRRTRGLYTFGTGAGWHGHMSRREGLRVWAMWNLLAPPLVAWKGYLPMSTIGRGEDLPLGVYRDWRRWCRSPNYFFGDPTAEFTGHFAEVEVPVVGVNSCDDPWAPPRRAPACVSHYPSVDYVTVDPRELGVASIGHFAYVRPACRALWPALGRWVDARMAG